MKSSAPQFGHASASRRGIALVITLLMLSVVTITAVAFLAVSRRERVAVSSTAEQLDARYIAGVGFNHAQGRLASRISAVTNRAAYGGFMVSTNYANPYFELDGDKYSFYRTRNFNHLTNVSYYANSNYAQFNLERAGDREAYARLLGNLYYDPRPPVFVQTNRNPRSPPDFRFYLDLNRNGRFETNGFIWERDRQGRIIGRNQRFFWGDPEWIGILENPDVPHSGTNRFLGRFAYVVVPTSRMLDVNYIGNNAKRFDLGSSLPGDTNALVQSGFLRNQGVGSWEINLAAFFGTLNTNVWLYSVNDYQYETNASSSAGVTFSDAERIRRFRQGPSIPQSADEFYRIESGIGNPVEANNTFERDLVDGYSDGPLILTVSQIRGRLPDNDGPNEAWAGSDQTNHFTDLNNWFDPSLGLGARITGQYTNLNVARTSPLSTYDRYTFSRLISQLGTDSSDNRFESGVHPIYSDAYRGVDSVNQYGFYRRAKLNLNYAQDDVGGATLDSARISSFRPWQALEWFTNAAHRLLLSEFTNGLPFFPPRLDRSAPGLPIHGYVRMRDVNNAEYLTNYVYDAQVHRLVQVAANVYDATTNQFLLPLVGPLNQRIAAPSVFRPLVYEDVRTPGVLRLHSYEPVGPLPVNNPIDTLLLRAWASPDLVTNGAPQSIASPPQRLSPSLPELDPPVTSRERGFNVFGLPWVVGAKKGLPNFNQALWQTVFQPTRRLVITRPTRTARIGDSELPFGGANSGGFRTEYQYIFNITNLVGIEAWNSYFTNFSRPVRIFATNVLEFALRDETQSAPLQLVQPFVERRELLSMNFTSDSWPARQYLSGGFQRNTASSAYRAFPPQLPTTVQPVLNGNLTNGLSIGMSFIYDPVRRLSLPLTQTNEGRVAISQANRRYLTPVISAYVTNQMFFTIIDQESGRLLDAVTLRSVMVRTNLLSTLGLNPSGAEQEFFQEQIGGQAGAQMPAFWSTNLVQNNRTRGMDNQMLASIGALQVPVSLWRSAIGASAPVEDPQFSIDGLRYFLYGTLPPTASANAAYAERIRRQYGSNLVVQVGFNPSPKVFLSDRRMANDPLVHYTRDDLGPGYFFLTESGYTEIPHEFFGLVRGADFGGIQLTTNFVGFDLGRQSKFVNLYAPWGVNPNFAGNPVPVEDAQSRAYDYGFKDSLIQSPDSWNFPVAGNDLPGGVTNQFRFGNVGELGRVHRGTPWQTIYLKSRTAAELDPGEASLMTRLSGAPLTWAGWAGNRHTHPTNDWKFMDLFTTAYNDNAARGQLGVNQAGHAAWSAMLSSVPLFRNTVNVDDPQITFLEPNSPEILEVLTGYTDRRGQYVPGILAMTAATNASGVLVNPNGAFPNLGSILQVPTLSDRAPFIRTDVNWPAVRTLSDEILERVPQQILSLLRADEPRFVIYSFGQTLKPAPNAVNLRPGPLYGIATNYSITGEYVTKTVLRLDGDPRRLEPVIEDQRVILSNP